MKSKSGEGRKILKTAAILTGAALLFNCAYAGINDNDALQSNSSPSHDSIYKMQDGSILDLGVSTPEQVARGYLNLVNNPNGAYKGVAAKGGANRSKVLDKISEKIPPAKEAAEVTEPLIIPNVGEFTVGIFPNGEVHQYSKDPTQKLDITGGVIYNGLVFDVYTDQKTGAIYVPNYNFKLDPKTEEIYVGYDSMPPGYDELILSTEDIAELTSTPSGFKKYSSN